MSDGGGSLAGRIAVVTGGTGGIGAAVCARFAREGATVYAADIAQDAVDLPKGVTAAACNVTRPQDITDLMTKVESAHDRLDILVNAAGIEIEKTVEQTSLEEWNSIRDQRDGNLSGL